MLRSLVTILACLPLLLPPGACVCDLFQTPCESCAEVEAAPVVSSCSCCQHQHVEEAEVVLAKGHTCVKSAPDREDRHLPGCPAKNGGSHWRVEPATTAVQADLAFVALITIADASFSNLPPVASGLAGPSSADQPLYLTLLNLRI